MKIKEMLNEGGERLVKLVDMVPYKRAIGATLLAAAVLGSSAYLSNYSKVSQQEADAERRIFNCFVKPIMEGEFPSKYSREQYKPGTYDAMGKSYLSGYAIGDLFNNQPILSKVADDGRNRKHELTEKIRNELRDGRLEIPDNCK